MELVLQKIYSVSLRSPPHTRTRDGKDSADLRDTAQALSGAAVRACTFGRQNTDRRGQGELWVNDD